MYCAAATEQSYNRKLKYISSQCGTQHALHDRMFHALIRAALYEEIDHNVQILDFESQFFKYATTSAKIKMDKTDLWPASDSPEQVLHNKVPEKPIWSPIMKKTFQKKLAKFRRIEILIVTLRVLRSKSMIAILTFQRKA